MESPPWKSIGREAGASTPTTPSRSSRGLSPTSRHRAPDAAIPLAGPLLYRHSTERRVTGHAANAALSPQPEEHTMHKIIGATAVAAVLTLATPNLAGASGGCGHAIEGSDRGTFSSTPLDATHVVTDDHAIGYARHVGHYTLDGSEVINLATLEVSDG